MAQIPSTSVSMDTIKSELTSGGGSVSNDLLTFFASGAKINPWSQYKPIHIANKDFVDIGDSAWGSWDFGLYPQTTTSLNTVLKTAVNNPSSVNWTFKLPTGGSASPYRLGDFRLYRRDATSPFRELSCNSGSVGLNEGVDVELYCRFYSYNGELGINDMSILNGKYACLICGYPDGYPEKVYYSSEPISSHHGLVTFKDVSFSTERTRYMAAAICYTKYGDTSTGYSNTYYMLPIPAISVKWEQAITTTSIYGTASLNTNNGDLSVSIQMTSKPGTTTTFSNVTIQVGYQGSTGTGSRFTGTIGTYTVSGGTRQTASKLFYTSGLASEAEQGKLYYRIIANNGSYNSGEKQLGVSI